MALLDTIIIISLLVMGIIFFWSYFQKQSIHDTIIEIRDIFKDLSTGTNG